MVIEDFRNGSQDNKLTRIHKEEATYKLAHPLDRFAAFVIDHFIVLSPVLLFINAPYKKWFYKGLLLEENYLLAQSILLTFVFSFIFIYCYRVLMTLLIGSTLGKKFLGLEIVNVWNQKRPSILSLLLREFTWWFGILTFGFTYLSICTNEKRRAFHDRLSDTIVISKRNRYAELPSLFESSVVRGFVSGILAFLLFVSFIIIQKTQNNLAISSHITKLLEDKGELCKEIGDEIEQFSFEGKSTTRLETAMTLYSASIIDETCLEKETNYLFKHDVQEPLMYLAKSFLYKDKPKLSDSYLERVCELNVESPECHLSKILNAWDKENWSLVQELFRKTDKDWPTYIHIWAIKNAVLTGNTKDAKFHLEALPNVEMLKPFKFQYHLKSQLAFKSGAEIEKYMQVIESLLPKSELTLISGWLCHNQLNEDCEFNKSSACQILESSESENEDLYVNLSLLKLNSCHGKANILSSIKNRETKKLAHAINELKNSNLEAQKNLLTIYRENKYRNLIREEAGKYLVQSTQDLEILREFVLIWKTQQKMYEWLKTGRLLFDKLVELKSWELASEVGMGLLENYKEDVKFYNPLIQALYFSGNKRKAWELSKEQDSIHRNREPASIPVLEKEMNSSLKEEFEGL